MLSTSCLEINLDHIESDLKLTIDEKSESTLYFAGYGNQNLEADYQLKEGCSYDYEFNNTDFSFLKNEIIIPHKRKCHLGVISPSTYVGTLKLSVLKNEKNTGEDVELEVQSVKTDYRSDYRDMLEYITEQCTDLLLQSQYPVHHHFDVDFSKGSLTLYQRFSFIKSIILTDEFNEAVHRILISPSTTWAEEIEDRDIRGLNRIRQKHIRGFSSSNFRSPIPDNHFLKRIGIPSLPQRIEDTKKVDTVDTPENRFVKFAFEVFLKFFEDIRKAAEVNKYDLLSRESAFLHDKIETWIQHSMFKKISRPASLKLNSPILRRKEGYREILRVWLMFDLAAKLIWTGGEDVYKSGKKDIAVLYEYWLFFKLLNLFREMFSVPSKELEELIIKKDDGLNLTLKQGRQKVLCGIFAGQGRNLNVRFYYNRIFPGKSDYPGAGSWTTTMRPDYTLSIWPEGVDEKAAELEELIVHIHFDAKYKIANFADLLNAETNLDEEKEENRKGIYKNADILKMHAYKDAIRRSGGAYVLYPGDIPSTKKGFHEIIPGLGAFPIKPSKTEDGISELKYFVAEVINHFCNRASQRERAAYRTYEIHKDKSNLDIREPAPEPYGENRSLIPAETHILVAYYRKENWDWIIRSGLYNARAGNDRGSLRLGPGESGAKYILLHTSDELNSSKLLKVTEIGPRIFSQNQLKNKGYPNPTQAFYLVYKVKEDIEKELKNTKWDIRQLPGYKKGHGSPLPFAVTLADLMKNKIK